MSRLRSPAGPVRSPAIDLGRWPCKRTASGTPRRFSAAPTATVCARRVIVLQLRGAWPVYHGRRATVAYRVNNAHTSLPVHQAAEALWDGIGTGRMLARADPRRAPERRSRAADRRAGSCHSTPSQHVSPPGGVAIDFRQALTLRSVYPTLSVLVVACPVRLDFGDAGGRHRRAGPIGGDRRAHQERRGPGTARQGTAIRVRQDRHHHRGEARAWRARLPDRDLCRRTGRPCRHRAERAANIRSPGSSSRGETPMPARTAGGFHRPSDAAWRRLTEPRSASALWKNRGSRSPTSPLARLDAAGRTGAHIVRGDARWRPRAAISSAPTSSGELGIDRARRAIAPPPPNRSPRTSASATSVLCFLLGILARMSLKPRSRAINWAAAARSPVSSTIGSMPSSRSWLMSPIASGRS